MTAGVHYLRNRKHFPCFHTVIEIRVEVWENEREFEVGTRARMASFPRYFGFFQTFTSVPMQYNVWEHGKSVFYFFYKITRRKLKLALFIKA